MKYQTINVPHINVNDNQATISKIHVKEGDLVIHGQVVWKGSQADEIILRKDGSRPTLASIHLASTLHRPRESLGTGG